jgi:hypothetical protein
MRQPSDEMNPMCLRSFYINLKGEDKANQTQIRKYKKVTINQGI